MTSEELREKVKHMNPIDDNHVLRVRYNTSLTTANIMDPGTKFEKVPRILSIFISKKDIIADLAREQGMSEEELKPRMSAVYHVDRIVRETGQILDNGIEEIYVNSKVKDGTDASDMMTIFTDDEAYDREKFPAISERKWRFKNSEKEVAEMGYSYEEIKNEGRAEGRAESQVEWQDLLSGAIHELKTGRTKDELLASGYDIDTVNRALTCV